MPDGRRLTRAELTVGGGLIVLQAVVTLIALRHFDFNADDVWVQTLWSEWRPFGTDVSLPRDTYVLHAVIALPVEAVLGRGVAAITVTSLLLNLAALLLVLRFIRFFAGRLADGDHSRVLTASAIVGVWYVMLGNDFLAFAARPNHRNIELGLMLAVIQGLVLATERPGWDRRTLALALITGLLYFDDPMLVVAAGLPWCVVKAAGWFLGDVAPTWSRGCMAIGAGLLTWAVTIAAFESAGIEIAEYAPPVFVELAEVPTTLLRSLDFVLQMFGADFGGRDLRSAETIVHLGRLGVVTAIGLAAWQLRSRIPRRAGEPVQGLLAGALGVLAATTFATIGAAVDRQNSRYAAPIALVLVLFALVPLLLGDRRVRTVCTIGIAGFCALTLATTARDASNWFDAPPRDQRADRARTLGDHLSERRADTVFGPFWVALPLEYWSPGDFEVTAITCASGTAEFDVFARRDVTEEIPETAVVLEANPPIVGQCTAELLAAELGQPISTEMLTIDAGETITLHTFAGERLARALEEASLQSAGRGGNRIVDPDGMIGTRE